MQKNRKIASPFVRFVLWRFSSMFRLCRIVGLLFIPLLLVFSVSCSSAQRGHGLRREVVPQRKSVWVGELLAIFPGILWHGVGHRYAGDKEEAEQIELLEAYSLLGAAAGGGLVAAGQSNDNLVGLEVTGYGLAGFSVIAFIGTWIYDIIYTPAAVNRYNAGLGEDDDDEK